MNWFQEKLSAVPKAPLLVLIVFLFLLPYIAFSQAGSSKIIIAHTDPTAFDDALTSLKDNSLPIDTFSTKDGRINLGELIAESSQSRIYVTILVTEKDITVYGKFMNMYGDWFTLIYDRSMYIEWKEMNRVADLISLAVGGKKNFGK